MMNQKNILLGLMVGWGGLGYIRGTIDYEYNRSYREPFLYTNMFGRGVYGFFIYINPVLLPYTVYKELYRLEVCLRQLDSKNTDFYKKLL